MKRPQLPLDGGCACHAVRYRITALPLIVYACHCTDCQTQSGSAFTLSMSIAREAFALTAGTAKAWRRALSEADVAGWFCDDCGVRLYGERSSRPTLNVRAGTIDQTSWLRPGAHIFMRSAQPWERLQDDAVCFETMPPDFASLAKSWRASFEE